VEENRRNRREHIGRREDLKMKYDALLVNVITSLLLLLLLLRGEWIEDSFLKMFFWVCCVYKDEEV
jgi:hypothetical protein